MHALSSRTATLATLWTTLNFALLPSAFSQTQTPSTDGIVKFTWALIGNLQADDIPRALHEGATLRTGDGLKLFVEQQSPCTLYALHRGPDGIVTRLFPTRDTAQQTGKIYVPAGGEWLRLDARTGTERFFVVASAAPLPRLQALLDLNDTAADEVTKRRYGDDIESEIVRTAKELKPMSKPAERPAIIGGTVRGLAASDMPEGVAVVADGFFLKVLTLEHR